MLGEEVQQKDNGRNLHKWSSGWWVHIVTAWRASSRSEATRWSFWYSGRALTTKETSISVLWMGTLMLCGLDCCFYKEKWSPVDKGWSGSRSSDSQVSTHKAHEPGGKKRSEFSHGMAQSFCNIQLVMLKTVPSYHKQLLSEGHRVIHRWQVLQEKTGTHHINEFSWRLNAPCFKFEAKARHVSWLIPILQELPNIFTKRRCPKGKNKHFNHISDDRDWMCYPITISSHS